MHTEAAAFLCAALVCAALTPIITRFAKRRKLFDHITNSRKVHSGRIPRLGGIAIVAGFYAPLLALILYPTGLGSMFYADAVRAFAFLFGGLAIAGLGIFDDIFGCGAVEKFCVQVLVALYVFWAGFRIDTLLLGDAVVPLGVIGPLVTVLWIVGVINALNLIDGLDGLAAGIALATALTNFVIAWRGDQPLMGLWMAALAGSIVAFLRFNFHPATIFMGDGGSLFLGYVLAVASIRTSQKSSAAVSLLIPIVALALPIADTLLAMARRGLRGRPMFSGDKEHIHHRLLAVGLSHRQVVLVLYGVAAFLGGVAIGIATFAPQLGMAVLIGVVLVALIGLRRLGFFRLENTVEALNHRRRNLELRHAVREVSESLRTANSLDAVMESVAAFAPALSADRVRIELSSQGDRPFPEAPSASPVRSVPVRVRGRFPIEPGLGHVIVDWTHGDADRDHEIAVETLSRAVARALERTSPGEAANSPDSRPLTIRPAASTRRNPR